jgi:hypothetical protein
VIDRLGHPHPLRKWFVAVMVMWMVVTVLLWGRLAQDALPFVVAGDLVHDQPGEIYGSSSGYLFDLNPVFSERLCRAAPAGTDCDKFETGYVSAPAALPFALVITTPGPDFGVLLARLLAAGALVAGMLVLWHRLAGRSREAPRYLVATAVLLTPMAMVPITLGQTSPYLFLVACLGVRRTDRRGSAVGVAAAWALTIALKVFPAALGLVLLRQRRFRLLALAALALVGLGLLSLAIAPVSIWSDFVHMSSRLATRSLDNPYNGSLDSAASHIWHPLVGGTGAQRVLVVLRVALGGGLWWWGVRDADDDSQWAYGWLVVLFVVPLVWWHYLWLAVAAVGVVLARPEVDRRLVGALPLLAAATIPISVINATGSAWPVVQGLFLLGVAVAVAVVARRSCPSSAAVVATVP